jgi:signal transduction histidine kinase
MSDGWIPRRLRTRLFLSYVVVVGAGALAMLVVGTAVTRTVYERRLGGLGLGRGPGRQEGVNEAQLTSALDESLVPALLAGVGAALIAAVIVALFVGGRLLRPIDELRAATRRMAAGDYATPVPVPQEIELASLALDVNRLGEHLATTERRRTHLLGEVTHELRTPITVIRGQTEGLIDGIVAPSTEAFVAIADEAARLQRIVDDLTLLSRADEGTLDVRCVELDLAAVAASAAERLRPQFDFAGVTLEVDVGSPPAPLPVLGDVDRLTQILSNLLGNALGHTPDAGMVTVRTGREGSMAFVDVVDTGHGIPADEVDRIFERFYRGPTGTSSRAGRGIGLTIARGLARAHGGDVVAFGGGSGGARFRLTVPARPA